MKKIREIRTIVSGGFSGSSRTEDRVVAMEDDKVPAGAEVVADAVAVHDWATVQPDAPKPSK